MSSQSVFAPKRPVLLIVIYYLYQNMIIFFQSNKWVADSCSEERSKEGSRRWRVGWFFHFNFVGNCSCH